MCFVDYKLARNFSSSTVKQMLKILCAFSLMKEVLLSSSALFFYIFILQFHLHVSSFIEIAYLEISY